MDLKPHSTRGRGDRFFWTQLLSPADIVNYSPSKFDIQTDIEYMDYHFEGTDAIPDPNWKPLFDPEDFEKKNKPLSLQKHALSQQRMLAEGKLATSVRERILNKAH
jgi:hypothetical protein